MLFFFFLSKGAHLSGRASETNVTTSQLHQKLWTLMKRRKVAKTRVHLCWLSMMKMSR